jgi:zinc protease
MNKYILLLSAILVFSQCTKKVAETVTTTPTAQDPTKAWRNKAPGPGAARPVELGTYTDFELANGLKVIVVENHKLPRVSYQLSFNNDALIEGDKAGYTSFAGDLISKGTKMRTKAQIDEAIDYIGASMNSSATGIFGSSLKKHSSKLLDIMTDVLYNPTYSKEEFEKIRKRTASNLISAKTSPEAIASNIKSIVNYGAKHPYGEVQTEETIKMITVDDCKNYINTYFKPNNAFLVIVGDITPAEARTQVEQYFAQWKKGDVPAVKYAQPSDAKGAQVRFGNKDGAVQSVIEVTYPLDFRPGNADAIKASLMNNILGGGSFGARLMQNLREGKAYTYGSYSSINSDKLTGSFSATASVRNMVTDSSITEILYEMNRIVNEPVLDKDLALAKSNLTGSFGRSLESPQTIANFALNTFKYGLPKDYYNNYLRNVDAVTIADIQAMAKKYIKPSNCNIIVVGNKDNVADKIKKFDSDSKIDFYDAYGKLLEDKKIEVAADVTAESVIGDYIDAIGGKSKLTAVTSLKQVMTTSLMGQEATFETYTLANDKFAMKINMMNMTVQEQRFDGTKGLQSAGGQSKVVTEADELKNLKEETIIFEQLEYNKPGHKLELKGIDNVDGVNCYKILVNLPNGKMITEFYDVTSSLLIRTVTVNGENAVTVDYKNYKEVDGIKFPYSNVVSGMMPQPLSMEVSAIEINKPIDAAIFKVE